MPPLVVLQCSEFQRAEILKQYGRTPDSVQDDIENIRKWLSKQPHLPESPCDKMIERYLIGSKFHIEKLKPKLDMYYSVRSLIPEFYDKEPSSAAIRKIMDVIYIVPLPNLSKKLQRIFIIKLKDYDVENYNVSALVAHIFRIAEIRIREECTLSDIYIYDLKGFTLGHLLKYTPALIKKFTFILEKVFPNKIEGLHFINAPSFMDSLVSLIATYFKPKIASRIFVHTQIDSLYEVVEKGILPKDYGGQEGSLEELQDKWKQKFEECDELLTHLRSLKVDENLRLGKPLTSDILGIDGNFRQLQID